ncbi:hypothetical protein N7495_000264 [Penicillium taxi]|uniref:uncharacterized protein n=1 Tax=Penicillium taxi TaxID=168475 RepID=UPI0025459236|nr:uncharacterized protein N7495_000264 [Penicillium taxi]KAJ5907582.1 hypothetical protein N7495_000264 [Penicillium taxi]
MPELSSTERKRLRDRRAQQNLRDKKLRHTTKLEEQLAHCEQYHNDKGVQQLLDIIKGLRKQNETLQDRQKSLKTLVNSWDGAQEMIPDDWNCSRRTHPKSHDESLKPPILNDSNPKRVVNLNTPTSPTSTPPQLHPNTNLSWNQLPLYSDDFSNIQTTSCFCKTNLLANMIHTALCRRPIRDPEKLATGWLAYHFTRWIFAPSPSTYSRLPDFMRPVQDQLRVAHPLIFDLVCWPRIRLNLIRKWQIYDKNRDELFGLFGCCVKLRWPWGEKILERNEDNEITTREEFYNVFMKEEGWGVTQEFINQFPELMDGIDIDSLVATMT